MEYTTPQKAPYPVGTRLKRLRPDGSMSGAFINGEPVYYDRDGSTGTVIEVHNQMWLQYDEETGVSTPVHGYSVVQFDDDSTGASRRCLDVTDLCSWERING